MPVSEGSRGEHWRSGDHVGANQDGLDRPRSAEAAVQVAAELEAQVVAIAAAELLVRARGRQDAGDLSGLDPRRRGEPSDCTWTGCVGGSPGSEGGFEVLIDGLGIGRGRGGLDPIR